MMMIMTLVDEDDKANEIQGHKRKKGDDSDDEANEDKEELG